VTRAPAPGAAPDRMLLVTWSPRLPPGLLSHPGWTALRAGPVYTADPDLPQARAVREAGIEVRALPVVRQAFATAVGPGDARRAAADGTSAGPRAPAGATGPGAGASDGGTGASDRARGGPDGVAGASDAERARVFRVLAADGGTAVWLAGPDGEPGFAAALGELVARAPTGSVELEVVYASWDPPGSRLLDVVAVMDRLRSPGGCPWDAGQTHASLAEYLLEEAYETLEAIEDGDLDLLREELGDVLLQVAFHSRLAEELPAGERWSIDDVAGDLVAKLIRRHPHVFADAAVTGPDEVEANWDVIKAAEKRRSSATDGVPLGQPALSLAAKLLSRTEKAGVSVATPAGDPGGIGARLFDLAREARAAGVDPEAALRAVARDYRDAVVAAERAARAQQPGAAEPGVAEPGVAEPGRADQPGDAAE
jgi:XTP/dITP diphosphohydrolase